MNLFIQIRNNFSKMSQSIFHTVYKYIFHETPSLETMSFVHNLYYITIGTIISTIFFFIYQILAGRYLGPEEYGKYTLIKTISTFMYIPMLLGINTAMVKYASEKRDIHSQRKIISTAYIMISLLVITLICIYFSYSSKLSQILSIPSDIYKLSTIFSIISVYYILSMETLRGLHKMRVTSILKFINSLILVGVFLWLIFMKYFTYKAMVFSTCISYIVIVIFVTVYLYKYFKLEYDSYWVKALMRYSGLTFLSAISYLLYTNTDKIMINKYMTVADVGIYNAYYLASINLMGMLSGIFITVFFPTVSKYNEKKAIFRKINRIVPFLFIVGIPFCIMLEYIILKLYGNEFNTESRLMIIFAVVSIIVCCYELYAWLLNAEGEKGIIITFMGTGTIAIINIVLNLYTIPRFGLYGAIGSTLLAYILGMCLLFIKAHNYYELTTKDV